MGANSDAATTFLTRRVVMDHEIVTYRVLSRELSVHVNEAKRWLEEFLEQSKQSDASVHATYVVSGEALPTPATDANVNPVEDEGGNEFGNSQASSSSSAVPSVPTWQILLTPAEDLEQCKGRFLRISSIHVYSLSPATLKNPALLVTTTTIVRQRDSSASNPPEHAKVVGMTLNPNWNSRSLPATSKAIAAKSMPPPPVSAAASSKKEKEKDDKNRQDTETSKAAAAAVTKKAGTLDWGKAKVKSKDPAPKSKPAASHATKLEMSGSDAETKPVIKAKTEPELKAETAKRATESPGLKPKPSASGANKPAAKRPAASAGKPLSKALGMQNGTSTARLKKRVLVSDTEDDEDAASQPSVSAAPAAKKPRKSDRVMLESDDEERSQSSASESEPEHVPLSAAEARRTLKGPKKEKEIDIDTLAKKEKRERGKTEKRGRVPKGKRRVQKERTFVNERGRTVTEDYWTLESASDDADEGVNHDNDSQPASATAKKSREDVGSREKTTALKAKARASSARDTDVEEGPPKTKRKSEAASAAKPKSEDGTKDVEKTAPRGPAKSLPKSAPPLKEKKSGQQTLAGFFKK